MRDSEQYDTAKIAQLIRDNFRTAKGNQIGRPYRGHPDHDKWEIWETAADLCIESEADPVDFVSAAFALCTVPRGPFPKHMASKAATRWYSEYVTQVNNSPEKLTEADYVRRTRDKINYVVSACLSMQRRTCKPMLEHLADPYCRFPAWVRVLLAPGNYKMRYLYLGKAQTEISRNPVILKALQELEYDTQIFKISI